MICEQLAPAPAIIDRTEPETGDDVKGESDDEDDMSLMELLGGLGSAASVATKWSMSGLSNVRSAVKTTVSRSGGLAFIWFNVFIFYLPYSRIRHIETITRQPLQMADRACNCWFYFICNKFNVLIFNMEYAK